MFQIIGYIVLCKNSCLKGNFFMDYFCMKKDDCCILILSKM